MKRYILSILLIFQYVFVHADGKFIGVYFADTNDESIGTSVATDIVNMERLFNDIRLTLTNMGYSFSLQKYTGTSCCPEKMNTVINSLSCENDIVLLYYSGHGGRSHNDIGKFPRMCLGSHYANEWIKVSDIVNRISSKKPRFFVVISDCCNSYYDRKKRNTEAFGHYSLQKENIKRLFLDNKGYINLTAASPGEFGQCTEEGGFLTLNFIKALYSTKSLTSWNDLLNSISINTLNDTKRRDINGNSSSKGQRPVFEINTSVNGNAVNNNPTNDTNDNEINNPNTGNNDVPPTIENPNPYNSHVNGESTSFFTKILNFIIFFLFGILAWAVVPKIFRLEGSGLLIARGISIFLIVKAILSLLS